jgi:hypothetical protein
MVGLLAVLALSRHSRLLASPTTVSISILMALLLLLLAVCLMCFLSAVVVEAVTVVHLATTVVAVVVGKYCNPLSI